LPSCAPGMEQPSRASLVPSHPGPPSQTATWTCSTSSSRTAGSSRVIEQFAHGLVVQRQSGWPRSTALRPAFPGRSAGELHLDADRDEPGAHRCWRRRTDRHRAQQGHGGRRPGKPSAAPGSREADPLSPVAQAAGAHWLRRLGGEPGGGLRDQVSADERRDCRPITVRSQRWRRSHAPRARVNVR
jgi:hypothetical protein